MKVVVTGGSGFIGQAVCRELKERGHDFEVFDRSVGLDLLRDRIPDCDHVIHLAGVLGTHELFDTPELAIDINVKGALRVLQRCAELGAGYTGIQMPHVFQSVYSATKQCANRLAEAWRHNCGVPTSYVRAFNAFGPGQRHGPGHPRKIIPAFATEAWRGDPLIVWGDGEQTVDLVYVDDVARMLVDATAFGDGQMFDGGTGQRFTVNATAEMVIAITGSTSKPDHQPMRRGEVPTDVGATGEGWDLLGWHPQFRYSDLVDTVESYR